MKEIEVEGKTVTHAVERGLGELGLRRDQVEVEVLQEANPGILGFGAKLAKVRIREKIWGAPPAEAGASAAGQPAAGSSTPARPPRRSAAAARPESRRSAPPSTAGASRPAPAGGQPAAAPAPRTARSRDFRAGPPRRSRPAEPAYGRDARSWTPSRGAGSPSARPSPVHEAPPDIDKACGEAKVVLEEILKLLKLEQPKISAAWDPKQVRVQVSVEGSGAEELLVKEGHMLESLQFLVTLILSRRLKTPVAVQVDCGGYWHEQEEAVLLQVHQAMEMVQRTRRPVRLQPMDSFMRRLIHRTLANHPEFETASEGEGSWRKVVIKPKRK